MCSRYRRDLIGRATFFCLVELPVRGVTRPPFPLLAKIRGLARETNAVPREPFVYQHYYLGELATCMSYETLHACALMP